MKHAPGRKRREEKRREEEDGGGDGGGRGLWPFPAVGSECGAAVVEMWPGGGVAVGGSMATGRLY